LFFARGIMKQGSRGPVLPRVKLMFEVDGPISKPRSEVPAVA
jgi:hypothetical protein